jgi:hypothetical protein
MPPFLYRCPNTGQNVQAWAVDDPEDPKNGKVLGVADDD